MEGGQAGGMGSEGRGRDGGGTEKGKMEVEHHAAFLARLVGTWRGIRSPYRLLGKLGYCACTTRQCRQKEASQALGANQLADAD